MVSFYQLSLMNINQNYQALIYLETIIYHLVSTFLTLILNHLKCLLKFNTLSSTTFKWKIEYLNNRGNIKGKEWLNMKEIEDKE
jgi:hypothetical protein